MNPDQKIIKPITHITAWLLLISFSFLLERNIPFKIPVYNNLIRIGLHAIVFYSTYLLLMPLLFKKKFWFFIMMSMSLLVGTLLIKQNTIQKPGAFRTFQPGEDDVFSKPPEIEFPDSENERSRPINKPRRGHFMLDFSSLFLFYVMAFSLGFVKKWQADEEQKSLLEKEKINTELQFLKQQINPHFLFNSLNSIYSLSLSKSENTTNSILKLSSILRYMLYESENNMVKLSNEIKTLKDYIDLQKLRLTEKVELNIEIQEDSNDYKLAPFILIPIIENAFKHGTDNINTSFINILLTIDKDILSLSVTNKIVQSQSNNTEHSGIGLKNIKRRLELLYKGDHIFESQKTNGNFTVQLELKLKK